MPAKTPSYLFATDSAPDGNRKGRKVGSRAKLATRFFEDTYAAWEEQGPSVLARAAFHDPMAFANMVARLMPQKIEVSTPTDGLSDERLGELLDFAERMAGLKAEQAKVLQGALVEGAALPSPHKLADENGVLADSLEGRGEGALREEGGGGVNTPSTLRPDRAEDPQRPFKPLNEPPPPPLVAETPQSRLPYPVGKPFAPPDRTVEKRNRAGLAETDVDPASLF